MRTEDAFYMELIVESRNLDFVVGFVIDGHSRFSSEYLRNAEHVHGSPHLLSETFNCSVAIDELDTVRTKDPQGV